MTIELIPSLEALLTPGPAAAPADLALAVRYAPILRFDAREPFLPLAAGFTVFRESGPSPSFPRRIELHAGEELAIEYAIWWDWDIGHVYELEHVWVYLDPAGRVVRGDASWHGGYHDMAVDGRPPLSGERLTVCSEPGKHAFAPSPAWFEARADVTRHSCGPSAGVMGVHVTPLFAGRIHSRTPLGNQLVQSYLERRAFEPSFDFDQVYPLPEEVLVPWPRLDAWIPARVAWWVEELERTISPSERRVLRIAHRGASTHAPQNTLAAIAKAAELGADMVELDVRLSADGMPVIIHDAVLGDRLVAELSLADLRTFDLGSGERVPTLAEAIEQLLAHHLGLYLELKTGEGLETIVETLRRYLIADRTLIASFEPAWLVALKALAPEVVTSVLCGETSADPVALAREAGALYVHPAWERAAPMPSALLTPEWIARVRAAGLGIISWHEERPGEIAALKRLGIDAICSDAPELLLDR